MSRKTAIAETNGVVKGRTYRTFPKNILVIEATGRLLYNAHDSRHLLAVFL
jgi:hypothetical protein